MTLEENLVSLSDMRLLTVATFLALEFMSKSIYAQNSIIEESFRSSFDSKPIEYFWSKPHGQGPFPLLLLIHPDQDSPREGGKAFVEMGQFDYWTKKGFVTVAISQPGYGKSEGPSDFCGLRTQQAALDLIHLFESKSDLVSKRIYVYGGSRGAVIASMIAAQKPTLSGIILKSGVYDFVQWSKLKPWYDLVRLTMMWEIGWLSESKLKERSALYSADKIKSPILIIHGAHDSRAPVEIAEHFSDIVNTSGGHAEFTKIDSEHIIPMNEIDELMLSFMNQH